MAEIELGLALYGLYGHTTYFKSTCLRLLIDLASRSAGSLKISVRHPVGRVRIEPWALIRPAKVKADACSIGGNTLRIYSYTLIRTQSYVCLFACACVCAQCLWLCAHWLDIEQISWLQIPKHIHAPVPCCLVSCWCRYEPFSLLAIVALFDILFAWYFCYVFYPAWIDRD